jgi:serine/threonine protein kinase
MSSNFNFKWRRIGHYDGQAILSEGEVIYELGNYLGGGASGSVYQAFQPEWEGSEKAVAIKILNPLGYKNCAFGQLNQYPILEKGMRLNQDQSNGKLPMHSSNVWWLIHPATKQIFSAFEDPQRQFRLRELPLTKCVEIWGLNPLGIEKLQELEIEKLNINKVCVVGEKEYNLPLISPKYLKFLKSRQQICREMSNMMQIGEHPNIIGLKEVLELIQDNKTTLFLVLDLINGGELFDRIKCGCQNNTEEFARRYFKQLLSGIDFCHKKGMFFFLVSKKI